MRRRRVLIPAAVVFGSIAFVGVEVQLARIAPRLDDEIGFRPRDLDVGSAAGAVPADVVWLGDSTSTGVGTDSVQDSMAFRVADTTEAIGSHLTILGVSGAQVHEVIADQVPLLEERVADGDTPDRIFVSIGANDVTALTRRSTFRSRYESMVAAVQRIAPDATIVLVGIPDMGTAPRLPVPLRQVAGVRAAQLHEVIEAVGDAADLHVVDLAGRTSRTFSSDPDTFFAADGFHPSSEGHAVWADAVVASIDVGPG